MEKKKLTRNIWFDYLRRNFKWLLLYLILIGMMTAIYRLYGLPMGPVIYGLLLGGFCYLLFLFADLEHYRKKIMHLQYLEQKAAVALSLREENGRLSLLEREYLDIIRRLEERCRHWEETAVSYRKEADRYYVRWSHQIKTPISAMQLLLQEEKPDPEAIRQELFKIEQYVGMALQYQRLEGDSRDLMLEEKDLDSLIRQAVKRVAILFIHRKVSVSIIETGWKVVTDEKWLVFVLEQILTNAAKYTKQGQVTIGPAQEESAAGKKLLCIRDTGIGIRPEDVPRVFEWGYTGYNGRQDKRATGIGLALCKESMEMLGHDISLTSRVGEGTSVILDFSRERMEFE